MDYLLLTALARIANAQRWQYGKTYKTDFLRIYHPHYKTIQSLGLVDNYELTPLGWQWVASRAPHYTWEAYQLFRQQMDTLGMSALANAEGLFWVQWGWKYVIVDEGMVRLGTLAGQHFKINPKGGVNYMIPTSPLWTHLPPVAEDDLQPIPERVLKRENQAISDALKSVFK